MVALVAIEAETDPADPLAETAWLSEVAAGHGLPSVVVAQAWLDRDDVEEVLAAHSADPLVRGIRHKPTSAAAPDRAERGLPGSMDDPAWRRGFARLAPLGLSFDLQTPWWHLDAARDLAADFPESRIILNHTGLPADRSPQRLSTWEEALRALAKMPNVAIKISGLGQPGQPWTVEANRPVVLTAIDAFGPNRAMFASNFPVDSLVASFETIFGGFDRITHGFPEAERDALFRGNAFRIYRITA